MAGLYCFLNQSESVCTSETVSRRGRYLFYILLPVQGMPLNDWSRAHTARVLIGREVFRGANQNTGCIHDSQWRAVIFSLSQSEGLRLAPEGAPVPPPPLLYVCRYTRRRWFSKRANNGGRRGVDINLKRFLEIRISQLMYLFEICRCLYFRTYAQKHTFTSMLTL